VSAAPSHLPAEQFPKKCKLCGRVLQPEDWPTLKYVGIYSWPGGLEIVEMRDCPGSDCRNTLSIVLPADTTAPTK